MPISMQPSARYVTQSSVWGICFRGPLTDRKIIAYQKQGLLGGRTALPPSRRKRKLSATMVLQTLLGDYT